MSAPTRPLKLMTQIYKKVLPAVHEELKMWKFMAGRIPNPELREQALMSIAHKTFHCEGGGIYSLLAGGRYPEVVKFIVAYQTISDYLDNLCDRSTSLDPADFRALHESMTHALTPGTEMVNYYRFREDQDDGGYLKSLVKTCQDYLAELPAQTLANIQPVLHELAGYYCDLQVHKHVTHDERVPRLENWFHEHADTLPEMSWYEFSASSGSTLGIFCIASYAAVNRDMSRLVYQIKEGYFPWVQGLHILLDYFIDQEEDRAGGDLNFCFYYKNEEEMTERFSHFIDQADRSIKSLPDSTFHKMINRGLVGIYLADRKVARQRQVKKLAKKMIRGAGGSGLFFFVNGWLYRRLKPGL